MHMDAITTIAEVVGLVGVVLQDESGYGFVALADDYNLSRLMEWKGTKIVGRGVLVEQVGTEWIVAWRPYDAKPEPIPFERD